MRGGSEVTTDYRYTGQRWQSALGLYYYRARWYDPQMRRFVQPGNPQALNRSRCGLSNPTKLSRCPAEQPETEMEHLITFCEDD